MSTAGELLRRERLKRNLELEQISRELKISRKMLEAIEEDHYERLPGGVFAKAFVRQYARLMGLEEEELAAQVQRAIEPPMLGAEEITQSAPRPMRPAVSPIEVPRLEEWESVGDRGFRLTGPLSAAALVVVVMLICSAVYAWMQRPRNVTPPASAPVTQASQTPQPPVASEPVASPPQAAAQPASQPAESAPAPQSAAPQEPPAATPPTATPTSPASAAIPAPQTPAAPGPVHVEVLADEPVWILARADGKFVYTGTLDAGSSRVIDGNSNVELRLGNAGGVTVSLNGKPIGPAGPKGQVRTLQFTSGGFQIVPVKPPAAPAPDPLIR
jgi:cytoskeleton protein RodZ